MPSARRERYQRPGVSPLIVGREREQTELASGLERAAAGQGHVIAIAGEPGIGKTRLVRETIERADDWRIVELNCSETDRQIPYAPLVDAVRQLVGGRTLSALRLMVGDLAAELPRLLPELGPVPAETDRERDRRQLSHALTTMILAEPEPLLIAVEDLHWCDDSSLEVLLHLAQHIMERRVLLVVTYRNDEIEVGLGHFLGELERQRLGIDLPLSRLSLADTGKVLRGLAGGKPLRADALHMLFQRSDGIPFFIEELVASLSGGDLDRLQTAVPRSVQDGLRQRVAGLSPEARTLLSLAAVAGRGFDFELLVALSGGDEPRVLEGLRPLISANLLVEDTADRLAFRHALTREAVYSGLLVRERRGLHRTVAAAILAAGTTDENAGDLAYHFAEAEEWPAVLDWGARAGERALRLFAPVAAVTHFNLAVRAAEKLGTDPPAALLRSRAAALEMTGTVDSAIADLERACEIAKRGTDWSGHWHALVDLGMAWAGRDYVRAGEYFEQAMAIARRLDDPAMVAASLNRMANWYLNRDQPAIAVPLHQEALEIAESLHDRRLLAETHDYLATAAFLSASPVLGWSQASAAITLFEAMDHPRGLPNLISIGTLRAPQYLNLMPWITPFDPNVESEIERALSISRQLGWRAAEAFALAHQSGLFARRGEYARGIELIGSCEALADEIEHLEWQTYAAFQHGAIALDLLDVERARELLRSAFARAMRTGSLYWVRTVGGVLLEALGGTPEATGLEDQLLADLAMESVAQRLLWFGSALGSLDLAPARALSIAERLQATAKSGRIPALLMLEGKARLALGDPAGAQPLLAQARDEARQFDVPGLEWRALLSLAQADSALGNREASAAARAGARSILERIAENLDELERTAFWRRVQPLLPAPTTPLRAAKAAFGGLTRREREIATLIAKGKSSRAIAEELVLSERTVEGHVGNILNKLGFSARTQIAAWAALHLQTR
ncbi:MAG: AAA family ATPase [Dehalococcoidia bacterium]